MGRRIGWRLVLAGALALTLNAAAPALAFDNNGGGDNGGDYGGANPGGGNNSGPPSLAEARADIKAGNWADAIAALKAIVEIDAANADAFNLLGYAYRNAGDNKRAMTAYVRALKLNPKHAGALEYQGVLYVKLGQLDKAGANLAKLEAICGTGCEEYKELAEAIGG